VLTAVTVKVVPLIDPVTVAVPLVGADTVTVGAEVYPDPPFATVIDETVCQGCIAVMVFEDLVGVP
jgi:hypothetical protein